MGPLPNCRAGLLARLFCVCSTLTACAADWPQFRGPRASGVADGKSLPVTWDVEAGTNVRWKTRVRGLGHASPIVVGSRVFIVTAISGDPDASLKVGLYGAIAPVKDDTVHTWQLICLSKTTGESLWEQSLYEGVPKIKRHTKATHANSTPASDGKHLVVFLGSEGLYCYDLDGTPRWKKDLGVLDSGYYVVPNAQWGFASSPVIYQGMVIVQCDVQKDSFLAAFDIDNGNELWRTPRADVPTWSTPAILETPDGPQVIVNGYKHTGGYDARTGKELWHLKGGGDIPVPTPVLAHDLIFFSSAHGMLAPLYAVRRGATGDITLEPDAESSQHIAWYKKRDGIYMQTPLVYGDLLYACRDNGVLSCYEAQTGEMMYRERLGTGQTGFTASAVAGHDKVYLTSELGDVYVVRAGPQFELLATNSMAEICMATPAISDGSLFFRTKDHVIAIGEPPASPDTEDSADATTRETASGNYSRQGGVALTGSTSLQAQLGCCVPNRCGTFFQVLRPYEGHRTLHLLRN
jgi:outer membrane protein assembly factor BamB